MGPKRLPLKQTLLTSGKKKTFYDNIPKAFCYLVFKCTKSKGTQKNTPFPRPHRLVRELLQFLLVGEIVLERNSEKHSVPFRFAWLGLCFGWLVGWLSFFAWWSLVFCAIAFGLVFNMAFLWVCCHGWFYVATKTSKKPLGSLHMSYYSTRRHSSTLIKQNVSQSSDKAHGLFHCLICILRNDTRRGLQFKQTIPW